MTFFSESELTSTVFVGDNLMQLYLCLYVTGFTTKHEVNTYQMKTIVHTLKVHSHSQLCLVEVQSGLPKIVIAAFEKLEGE